MFDIKAEGVEFIYVPSSSIETLLINREKFNFERPCPYILNHISDYAEYRIALFPNMFKEQGSKLYYLFWMEKIDLMKLDIAVIDKTYSDDNFKNSVKTVYQKTHCFSCNDSFHSLVIPPGDPYLGAPGLMENKIQRAVFIECPSCNSSLRQMVVKIF